MTDLARRIPMATPTSQPVVTPQDTPLKLKGGVPQTVSVRIAQVNDQWKAYFSVPGGEEYPGIEWACGGYALLITFVFDQSSDVEISELVPVTPALWFSDKYIPIVGGTLQQGCCVQSLPGTYHFNVKAKLGNKLGIVPLVIDPQIVVTPL